MMRRLLALVATLATVLSILTAAAPAAAEPSPCTKVWFTAPTYFGKFQAGQSRCVWPWDTANGWTKIYSWNDRSKAVIDYAVLYTRTRPNDGRVESTADTVHWIAHKHDVHLQFANLDLLGRLGCSGGFENSVTGAYQPDPGHPGEGLVRIGTGITDRCMRDKQTVLNTAKFEIGRAIIERLCGRVDPPRAGDTYLEIAAVTSAYAMKYLGATMNDGGVRPAVKDFWRATEIHEGRCG